MLAENELKLLRGKINTLQVNVGLLCNQTCRHCHLDAGPGKNEIMSRETMKEVIDFAGRFKFEIIDLTGGAPELVPHIEYLVVNLAPLTPRLMFRSNLSALNHAGKKGLMELLKKHKAVVVASMPSINENQTDSQRGDGIFKKSIEALQKLNNRGYGVQGSDLELNLVSNPSGAFLPQPQAQTEKRFRKVLKEKWGIEFNQLFGFANVPLGRFRKWLMETNNYYGYMNKLVSSFNPCSVDGLMCRSTVSVSWDGYLFDCDFNLAAGLHMGNKQIRVSDLTDLPEEGKPIAISDYCYTCTAGAGFT